jgi:C-terminal processing protease CtpA/Prc
MLAGGIALLVALAPATAAPTAGDYAADAAALDQLIVDNYAYVERWPGGALPDSPLLKAERAAVHDKDSLLHYAEHRIASLADHHAITGSSFKDSWAIVPSYADLWIDLDGDFYVVGAVRDDSPAARAGIARGDRLVAVDGVAVAKAVVAYWAGLGLEITPDRAANAARVLAAGRRDRPRRLTVEHVGALREVTLSSLYDKPGTTDLPPVAVTKDAAQRTVLRLNNSLGDDATIAAFDAAMAGLPPNASLVIDLTDTPSGGNTTVARAIMSWFATAPTPYQVHSLPAEYRSSGIERRWIELVVPRTGKAHTVPPTVKVGRWTGSMGEGLAIGLKALGARVCGDAMAGLLGAIYDFDLPTGLRVKFPAERLTAVWGQPREQVVPERCAQER